MVSGTKVYFYMPYILQPSADGIVLHRIKGRGIKTRQLPLVGHLVSVTVDGKYIDILGPDNTLYHICDSVVQKVPLPKEIAHASSCAVVADRCPKVWWCSLDDGKTYCLYPNWGEVCVPNTSPDYGITATPEYVIEEKYLVHFDKVPPLLVVNKVGCVRKEPRWIVIFDGNKVRSVEAVAPEYIPPFPTPQWSVTENIRGWPINVRVMTPEKSLGEFSIFGGYVVDAKGQVGNKLAAIKMSVEFRQTSVLLSVLVICDLSGSVRFSTAVRGPVKQVFIEDDYVYVYTGREESWCEASAYDTVHVFSAEKGYIHTVAFFTGGCADGQEYVIEKNPLLQQASDICLETRQSGHVPVSSLQLERAEIAAALLVSKEASAIITALSGTIPCQVEFCLAK